MMMLRSRSFFFLADLVLLLVICQHDGRPSFSLGFVVERRRRSGGNNLPPAEARHCGTGRVVQQRQQRRQYYYYPSFWGSSCSSSLLATKGDDEDDDNTNDEGADLAAEFFKVAQEKGIDLEASTSELEEGEEEEDEDEDDDEDDDEEVNYPQGAINAFLGYDTGEVGDKLAGNVSLTDDQLYSEVKERVLDTAGGFVDYVKAAKGDDDDDAEEEEDTDDDDDQKKPKVYEPPETVPDPELTAGEVVILVLDALSHNDVPTANRGVEILFGYSSPGSQIKNEQGLTPDEYAEFLKETEYKVLFDHTGASIDKADYSFDGKKAFFTARLNSGPKPTDTVSVNFILSTTGVTDDSCWLVDSLLIRPQSMRRRRRR